MTSNTWMKACIQEFTVTDTKKTAACFKWCLRTKTYSHFFWGMGLAKFRKNCPTSYASKAGKLIQATALFCC